MRSTLAATPEEVLDAWRVETDRLSDEERRAIHAYLILPAETRAAVARALGVSPSRGGFDSIRFINRGGELFREVVGHGVAWTTYRERRARGMSHEEALASKRKRGGQPSELRLQVEAKGLTWKTYRSRRRRGWPHERALNEPLVKPSEKPFRRGGGR